MALTSTDASCALVTCNIPYDLVTCCIIAGTVLVGSDKKLVSENVYTILSDIGLTGNI